VSKISNLSYNITELKISLNKINYDQSSKLLSIEILDYSFVGSYKKSTKIGAILDDIFKTLGQLEISRTDIFIIDINSEIISENIKIKNLRIKTDKEEKKEKKEDYEKKKSFKKGRKKEMAPRPADEVGRSSEFFRYRGIFQEPEESYEEREERPGKAREAPKKAPVARSPRLIPPRAPQPAPSATPPPPPGSAPPPGGGPPEEPTTGEFVERVAKKMESDDSLLFKDEISEDLIVYNLNMALQYYSVMMEGKSYLLYVYFSYEELKILDEEGKVVYRTQIKIETRKKEPPILTIKIEGDEFEVHPLYGEVIVKKDAVNPPVIIFSVMPIKRKKDKQKKKDLTRKYLNIYIDFEEKRISHTVLAILVQPKHWSNSFRHK